MKAANFVAAVLLRSYGAMLFLGLSPSSLAAEIVGPDSYLSVIAKAEPGSVIKLKPGVYYDGIPIVRLSGTVTQPIVIEAADPSRPPRFLARLGKNTISIVDAGYIKIRNLVLDGRGLPVDAVKAEGSSRYAHHITLEGLRIIRHGVNQGVVGISTKCPAWGWVIRRNVIARAGTGMYLGNSDGGAPFFDGVIEHNLVYDTLGYNLQIKHQHNRSANTDWPAGPHTTVIRHNVFSKYGNAAIGRVARPNVLVGHFPNEGHGANDRYVIYGNFFYANSTEALFQGEGNIALYTNLFVNPFGDAVHVQPHNDTPKNIWVFHNTVVAKDVGIQLNGAVDDYLRTLTGNIVFAASPGTSHLQMNNLVGVMSQAEEYLVDPRAFPGRLNLKPKSELARVRDSTCAPSELFPDAQQDFDGAAYKMCGIGAYAITPNSPRWKPNLSLKPQMRR